MIVVSLVSSNKRVYYYSTFHELQKICIELNKKVNLKCLCATYILLYYE